MLLELKDYLKQQVAVNLLDITQRFAITVEVARDLLLVWQNKGSVVKVDNELCGSRCVKCSPAMMERYRWVG